MNRNEFEVRLHACLDARRDPFDDEELVAWLDAHPEQLDAVARLWAAVQVLQASGAERGSDDSWAATATATASRGAVGVAARIGSPRSRRWALLVLGAGLAGAAAAWVVATIEPGSMPTPKAPSPAGRILSAVVEPITPTLGLATRVRATEVLVACPEARIEVFTQWSVR